MSEIDETALPCPFCGEADISASNVGEDEDNWFVGCMNPACEVNPCVFNPDSEADAIAAWNRRAAPLPAVEPVAWAYELASYIEPTSAGPVYSGWQKRLAWEQANVPEGAVRNVRALYALSPGSGEESK